MKVAMELQHADIVVECNDVIARSARTVWGALRQCEALSLPKGIVWDSKAHMPARHQDSRYLRRAFKRLSMDQRIMEIDDVLMLMTMEMTCARNVPWTAYASRLRVEPISVGLARISITSLVTPSADRHQVERMLKALLMLWLEALRRRLRVH